MNSNEIIKVPEYVFKNPDGTFGEEVAQKLSNLNCFEHKDMVMLLNEMSQFVPEVDLVNV